MAYDEVLAQRVRAALGPREGLREVRMFGGLAFMLEERMIVCVSTGGAALLVRVDPDQHARVLHEPGAIQAEMGRGRSMGAGWISVTDTALTTEADLESWLRIALDFHAKNSPQSNKRRWAEADTTSAPPPRENPHMPLAELPAGLPWFILDRPNAEVRSAFYFERVTNEDPVCSKC